MGPRRQCLRRAIGMLLLVNALAACTSDARTDDLREFVATADAGRTPRVEPLPEVKTREPFAYAAAELPDPFSATNLKPKIAAGSSGPRPDLNRRKEPLEAYPLDALQMVGTLSRGGQTWVVVQAPDGTVHRAGVGNHIGRNFGTIEEIDEDKVDIVELVQGALGNWVEREASLALLEQ